MASVRFEISWLSIVVAGLLLWPTQCRAEDADEEEEEGRPVPELLSEAQGLRQEGLAKARQSVEDRGQGEKGLAAEAIAVLERACALFEEVAERGKGAEAKQAEDALTEIYGALYWTRKLVAELVDAPPITTSADDAKEAWKEAVEFEAENPTDGAEVLLTYEGVVKGFPGTKYAALARQRILELVELLPQLPEPAVAAAPAAPPPAPDDPGAPTPPPAQPPVADVPMPPRLDEAALTARRQSMSSRDLAQALGKRLSSEDRAVRLSAALELQKIHDFTVVSTLIKSFKEESDPEVLEAVTEALRRAPQLHAVVGLRNLATAKNEDAQQLRCIKVLCDIGSLRAGEAIAEFIIKDPGDTEVLARGFSSLETMRGEGRKGLGLLTRKLKSIEHIDRAVKSLGNCGDARAGRYVIPFLGRNYLKKRYGPYMDKKMSSPGVRAMIQLGWKGAPYLIAGLGNSDRRQYCHYCLKEISGASYDMQQVGEWKAWYDDKVRFNR